MKKIKIAILFILVAFIVPCHWRLATANDVQPEILSKIGPILRNAIEGPSGIRAPSSLSPTVQTGEKKSWPALVKAIVVLNASGTGVLPSELLETLKERVESLGGRVGDHAFNFVQVQVPLDSVEVLAAWEKVKNIRFPLKPSAMQTTSTISEGVSAIGADRFRESGPDGHGVKVGVIDVGFDGYSSLLGLELPASVETKISYSLSDFLSTRHGTACAEIVHDVAPGAALYLANAGDIEVDFPNAISWFSNNGVSVVSSSIGLNLFFRLVYIYEILYSAGDFQSNYYENQMAMFEEVVDRFDQVVSSAASNGIVWSQAAGNDGRKKWEGMFVDSDGDGYLNFSSAENYNEIDVSAADFGDEMYVAAMWGEGDANSSPDDFDLHVENSRGQLVCSSIFDQKRTGLGVEICRVFVDWRTKYRVIVENYDASPQKIEILLGYENFPEFKHYVPSGTVNLSVPSYNADAITAGAVPFYDLETVQPYSSQGPNGVGVVKPDLVAPDEVSTKSYGALAFAGTSAAAPHVAGTAALVEQAHPEWTAARIKRYLEDTALDLGKAGKDNAFGSGMVDLSALANELGSGFAYGIYFPQISCDDGRDTHITVVYTGGPIESEGRFWAYDERGTLVSNHSPSPFEPNGILELDVKRSFENAETIKYIVFESDSAGFKGFAKIIDDGRYRAAYPAVETGADEDIPVSHVASDDRWQTAFALVNTEEVEKTVSFVFDSGETVEKTLAPKAHEYFLARDLFGGRAKPKIGAGVIENASGIAGVEIFIDTIDDRICAVVLKDESDERLFFSHVAAGDGWTSGVALFNPGNVRSNLTIKSYDMSGALLSPIKQGFVGPRRKYMATVEEMRLPKGAAWFEIETDNALTGMEVFSKANMLAANSVPGNHGSEGLFAQIERGGATGLVLVNTTDSSAAVVLACHDASGAVVAQEAFTFDAREKRVGSAQSFFSGDIENGSYISFESNRTLAGFQLNASSDGAMLDALPLFDTPP